MAAQGWHPRDDRHTLTQHGFRSSWGVALGADSMLIPPHSTSISILRKQPWLTILGMWVSLLAAG